MSTINKGAKPLVDNPVLLWSKRKLWTVRVVLWILICGWFVLGFYLHNQVVQSRAKVERNRTEAQRREEVIRRASQYRQDLEQRSHSPGVRNVFEGR